METVILALPATVIAAIMLFAAREVLEFVRRTRADGRKLRAVKKLLAIDCERNNWSVKSMTTIFKRLSECADAGEGNYKIELSQDPAGKYFVKTTLYGSWGGRPIPDAYKDVFSKLMLDAAAINKNLFEKLLDAYDAALELEHLKISILRELNECDAGFDHIGGLSHYGLGNLEEIYASLNVLYLECTGGQLLDHRVR